MSRIQSQVKNIRGDWIVEEAISLTPKNPKSVVLGLISSVIVHENINRKGLILINGSSFRVCLGFGTDAILDEGIILFPGGVFNMAEYDFYSGVINGISAGINSIMTIQEFA